MRVARVLLLNTLNISRVVARGGAGEAPIKVIGCIEPLATSRTLHDLSRRARADQIRAMIYTERVAHAGTSRIITRSVFRTSCFFLRDRVLPEDAHYVNTLPRALMRKRLSDRVFLFFTRGLHAYQ